MEGRLSSTLGGDGTVGGPGVPGREISVVLIQSLFGEENVEIDSGMTVGELINYVKDRFEIEPHQQLFSIRQNLDSVDYEYFEEELVIDEDHLSMDGSAYETGDDDEPQDPDDVGWTPEKKRKVTNFL